VTRAEILARIRAPRKPYLRTREIAEPSRAEAAEDNTDQPATQIVPASTAANWRARSCSPSSWVAAATASGSPLMPVVDVARAGAAPQASALRSRSRAAMNFSPISSASSSLNTFRAAVNISPSSSWA
jgi:hypothetical protein